MMVHRPDAGKKLAIIFTSAVDEAVWEEGATLMLMKVGFRIPVPLESSPPAKPGPLGVVRPPVDLDATVPLLGEAARLRAEPEVLPMRCLRCQGAVERGTAPVHLEGEGYRLAWEEVPAWVCKRCDLAYFEPDQVDTVRRALLAMRALKPADH
jgi:YgiT-type zinc finger domain-containing protein